MLVIVQTMLSIAINLRHIAILSNNHISHFETKTDVSNFISTMSFGFEWQLLDDNNQVIATHIYE